MKSRGIYENTWRNNTYFMLTEQLKVLLLIRGEAHLKDELMPKYAETIYNGFWFSSERMAMQKTIDSIQKNVVGDVRLKIYKGNVIITGRKSPKSLYNASLVSFDEQGDYNQKDAEGFIKNFIIKVKK